MYISIYIYIYIYVYVYVCIQICTTPSSKPKPRQVQAQRSGADRALDPHPRHPLQPGYELYRGTSLTRKRTSLEPYRRPMPRVLGGSWRGGHFLMGKVPLHIFIRCRVNVAHMSGHNVTTQC